ncbi:head decoration protein [Pseudomonas sp. PA1(2017)]|uniref:head decoration protein n=1 Tax=Pseudomonas sp. PA1(2017) TaxID=1932113 RepID=UPI0009686909|nr:head decoration protein [Pseudomonas sp. PA1(2017)]OLU15336.1 head decoration protein [Pseudomonas sp. PA1(2017)]
MTIKTEGVHAGEFLLSEARGYRSRENIIISAGAGKLLAGTLISILTSANAGQSTPAAGNTGDGVLSNVLVSSTAVSGSYLVEVTSAPADGAKFTVSDPTGKEIGKGVVGTQFLNKGLAFDLAEGATKFVKGDAFTIAVKAGLGEWVPYDDDGDNDGRRAASGVLWAGVDATENDVQGVAIVRDAEVIDSLVIGLDAPGQADLLAAGVIVRTSNPDYPTLGE